jgi:hypothetical protein
MNEKKNPTVFLLFLIHRSSFIIHHFLRSSSHARFRAIVAAIPVYPIADGEWPGRLAPWRVLVVEGLTPSSSANGVSIV